MSGLHDVAHGAQHGAYNVTLVAELAAAALELDARGADIIQRAGAHLTLGNRRDGVLLIRRAIARGTPRERDRLEPLLERAKRSRQADTGT